MSPLEQLQLGAEFCALLPYIYVLKLWQAHNEFMEELLNVTGHGT